MGTIKNFKYKLIKNFISEDEKNLMKNYCIMKHRNNFNSFDEDQSDNRDTMFYGDPMTESLMLKKRDFMEKETGLKLSPTYSFWRCYTKFADLKKHKDRPSCEISVTVNIGSDGTKWPIFINNKKFICEPGDGVIYLGCEYEHWREEFKGDYSIQTFLHYVDKNGPNKEWVLDKRKQFGLDKNLEI
tara:strand:- start:581 stop:1138 length:558 start_codon:yes stop_codon:yes gene_type:complete